MKKVYIAKHPTEAHLIKGLLESYSISCEVRGEVLEPQFTECWNCGTERSHDA